MIAHLACTSVDSPDKAVAELTSGGFSDKFSIIVRISLKWHETIEIFRGNTLCIQAFIKNSKKLSPGQTNF